jgi:hypothetical protein
LPQIEQAEGIFYGWKRWSNREVVRGKYPKYPNYHILKKPDKRSWSVTAIGRICAPVTGTRRENTMKIDRGIRPARRAGTVLAQCKIRAY